MPQNLFPHLFLCYKIKEESHFKLLSCISDDSLVFKTLAIKSALGNNKFECFGWNADFKERSGIMREKKQQVGRERGIDRILKLLSYLNDVGQPVRLSELPQALNAPKSTIYELVRALTDGGILEQIGNDNKIYFGRMIHLYGISYMRENALIRRGAAEVDSLSELTGETSELCVLNRNRQVIMHTHLGSRPMRISSQSGGQIPLPWTASARLLLAQFSPAEIKSLIVTEDLTLPDKRKVKIEDFIADCHAARDKNLVETSGLINSFTQCLATPIFDMRGEIQAAICLVLPIDIEEQHLQKVKQFLIESGRKLSMHS